MRGCHTWRRNWTASRHPSRSVSRGDGNAIQYRVFRGAREVARDRFVVERPKVGLKSMQTSPKMIFKLQMYSFEELSVPLGVKKPSVHGDYRPRGGLCVSPLDQLLKKPFLPFTGRQYRWLEANGQKEGAELRFGTAGANRGGRPWSLVQGAVDEFAVTSFPCGSQAAFCGA